MSKTGRTVVALAGAALLLVVANWFDTTIVHDALRDAQATFDMSGFAITVAVGSLLVAGCVLLIGALAWRAGSVTVGLAYAIVGGFIVATPWLTFNLAASVNGAPPALPEPLATAIGNIFFRSFGGSLNAAGTIGAAMLISGVVALVRQWRGRGVAEGRAEVVAPEVDPTPS